MNNDIPAWVADYIGIPFNENGYSKDEGFHCWSLVRDAVQTGWGIILPSYREEITNAYDKERIAPCITEGIKFWTEQEKEWCAVETPQLGDILFFRMKGVMWHCGLCLNSTFMLHVTEGINASLGKYNNSYWKPKFAGAYRHCSR